MSHLDYYKYQTTARGVKGLREVEALALARAHVYRRVVLPRLPQNRASRIAELACGHGSFLWWLKSEGFSQITGVDNSSQQVAVAREVDCVVEEADVAGWLEKQPGQSVDALVGIDLVEHLTKDDFMKMLKQSSRALTPGGVLILRYPNGDSPLVGLNLFNDITHVWTYTTNCVQTLAAMHGFARATFVDESDTGVRDHRWLKVPLARIGGFVLRGLIRAATRENVRYLSPHIWAFLQR
jgi:2-polyprenyl-3-methyl-5-hydroxy-6-metoxy-1,4-benzoquinol methylase